MGLTKEERERRIAEKAEAERAEAEQAAAEARLETIPDPALEGEAGDPVAVDDANDYEPSYRPRPSSEALTDAQKEHLRAYGLPVDGDEPESDE